MKSELDNDTAVFNLTYAPQNDDYPATSVATVSYYAANGALYVVSLSLDSTENGNRFDVMCLVYNGNEHVLQSSGWGYLDANSLVDTSTLTCYVFSGMNEYEDGLLLDYAAYLSRLISWLDYIILTSAPSFLSRISVSYSTSASLMMLRHKQPSAYLGKAILQNVPGE